VVTLGHSAARQVRKVSDLPHQAAGAYVVGRRMALLDIKKDPTRRELLVFGLALPAIFGVLGYFAIARGAVGTARTLWIAGGLATTLFACVPALRRPLYVVWMYLVFPIGWTVSHVIMAVLYFLVITPTRLIRLLVVRRDLLSRRFDRQATTYWLERPPPPPVDRYLRQY
jgi:hypothetical protein